MCTSTHYFRLVGFVSILANVFKAAAPIEVKLKDGTSLFVVGVDKDGKLDINQQVFTDSAIAFNTLVTP